VALVVFPSSDDGDAIGPVANLAKELGFAPVKLGKLNERRRGRRRVSGTLSPARNPAL
jgi:predicted dinucleotide-binding enzyme